VRPFLLVGCGGSGGLTLQFLMDQLSADLSRRSIHQIPAAWQFVHVDVPTAPDGVGSGLPPVVPEQAGNGRYVGMASFGASYPGVASAVSARLAQTHQLTTLATWRTDPREVNVPIVAGAGQMRSVGRVVTLSGIARVREGLQSAFDALRAVGASGELQRVADEISPGTGAQTGSAPVVLVVSSMAGGAGASMVLDVCRLLSQMPGIDPALIALFLYTPEVFESIPAAQRSGVPGNALAMAGELIASQLGAAALDDVAILESLGLGSAGGGQRLPFGRVFPIGLRIGEQGAKFADGRLKDVYRGVGRGLAALMLSGEATQEWVGFDLTNNNPRSSEQEHFGWGSERTQVQWGSFGFAQLSLGRDRYAEYAAQRLARSAVDRLVHGHRSPGAPGTDLDQLNRVVDDQMPFMLREFGLPAAEGLQRWWLTTVGNAPNERAQQLVARFVEPRLALPAATDARQWTAYVLQQMASAAPEMDAEVERVAYEWVHGWYVQQLARVQRTIESVISTDGLPTAMTLLERIGRDTDAWAQQLREAAQQSRRSAAALDQGPVQQAHALKGQIDARHMIVTVLRTAYQAAASQAFAGGALAVLADVIGSLRADLLEPLREACGDAAALLGQAVDADVQGSGLAQLRTDEFAEWPEGGLPVPARFSHAQNEVLLIDATTFEGQFGDHVVETTRGEASTISVKDGQAVAMREILLNRWRTAGPPPRGGLVERLADWRPAALHHDPGKGERVPARRGQFRVAVKPAEVLDRARSWVARPGMPFHRFVSVSLREYVADEEVADSVRATRTQDIRTKFGKVLELAQPLVGVNQQMVATEHNGDAATVAYKFSDVPFGQLPLGTDLVQQLEQRPAADPAGVAALRAALKPVSDASRVDVFGSFAPLSPLAFSSLLSPLAQGWSAAVMPAQRASFWHHRRSRRLPGAVAMHDRQRRAVVGGWYVARFIGTLRLPGEARALEAVEVWDIRSRGWVRFPHPLVTPKAELERSTNNYLPAVLLSYGLAMAQSTAQASVAPLLPYTILRKTWDDSLAGRSPHDPLTMLTATSRLRDWVSTGETPPGAPEGPASAGIDPEARRTWLAKRLQEGRDAIGTGYLRPGERGAPGGGRWSVIDREEELAAVPLFSEVAADVYDVYGTLIEIVQGLDLTGGDDGHPRVPVVGEPEF
jgi:hypothetical protein